MKIVNLVLAVMFLLFSFVQINDPDPVVWILIYGSMAVVCVMAAFKYYPVIFMIIQMVAFLAYSVILIPGVSEWLAQPDRSMLFDDVAKMQHLYVEEAREFLGLMICIAVLILELIRARILKRAV
jgi:hypothetical protein